MQSSLREGRSLEAGVSGSHGHGGEGARGRARPRAPALTCCFALIRVVWALLPPPSLRCPLSTALPGHLHEGQASELADGAHRCHPLQLLLFLHLQDDSDQ